MQRRKSSREFKVEAVRLIKDPGSAPAGLGTSIVQALAQQLRADVRVVGANSGTWVEIGHVEAQKARPVARGA